MIKSNGGIIGPDNVTTGGAFGTASGVFKLGEATDLINESKWPTPGPQGYQSANSCRFNSGSSDTLNRTPSGASNRKTFTISFWVKRAKIGSRQSIFNNTDSGGQDGVYFDFQADDTFLFNDYGTGSYLTPRFETTQLFRDTSAWYHIVYAVDTTQGTESNRVKIYVNGNQVTNFDVANYPSQNQDTLWNRADTIYIGTYTAGGNYLGAYLSEVINIDGQQLTPTSFGEFNSQTGIWVPKVVTGLTFGTNGFYLPFTNASALGEDFSGNDNDFTVNNLTSIDQSTDTCSTNFATWNPLVHYSTSATFSEGNLKVAPTENTSRVYTVSTIGMPTVSGSKWYAEFKYLETNDVAIIGILDAAQISYVFSNNSDLDNQNGDTSVGRVTYRVGNGLIKYPSGQSVDTGVTLSNNDIVMIALDSGSGKIWFGVNGTWFNSGNPATDSNGVDFTGQSWWTAGVDDFVFFVGDGSTGGHDDWEANFGSPPYAISSGNTDQNGFGNFEYAPPSGYLSLNTKNLAAVLA